MNITATWTAKQIGESSGAYSGCFVEFIDETGVRQQGTLTRSDWPMPESTMIVVDGGTYFLPNDTLVTVSL